jgi:hypothetical protein
MEICCKEEKNHATLRGDIFELHGSSINRLQNRREAERGV